MKLKAGSACRAASRKPSNWPSWMMKACAQTWKPKLPSSKQEIPCAPAEHPAFRPLRSGQCLADDQLGRWVAPNSNDWAAMLERMYLRWAERRGFQTDILDVYRRRRSRHQKRHHRRERPLCLRLSARRKRRPPPGAPFPIRFCPPPAYFLCPGRSSARNRG